MTKIKKYILIVLSAIFAGLFVLRIFLLPLLSFLSPVFHIGNSMGEFLYFLFHYSQVVDRYKEIEKLNAENEFLRRYKDAVEEENKRLKAMLNMPESKKFRKLIADVILRPPNRLSSTFYINIGKNQGVREGFGVIIPGGIVAGRIVAVSDNEARVVSLTDLNCAVAAIDGQSREEGIVEGQGNKAVFRFLNKNAMVRKGDVVLTSSLSGFFPPGMLIGEVSNVSQDGIESIAGISPCIENMVFYEAVVLIPAKALEDLSD